jgi:hypothetical protein
MLHRSFFFPTPETGDGPDGLPIRIIRIPGNSVKSVKRFAEGFA